MITYCRHGQLPESCSLCVGGSFDWKTWDNRPAIEKMQAEIERLKAIIRSMGGSY